MVSPLPRRPPASEHLLTPREVAEIFGVRTTTIARWAREGRLTPLPTPGGHRRYTHEAVLGVLEDAAPGAGGSIRDAGQTALDSFR